MVIYHGTKQIISKVDLNLGRLRTDFGKGFYTTNNIETAKNWALRVVSQDGGIPTVLRYNLNDAVFNQLIGVRFPNEPDLNWLNFICFNRKRRGKNESKQGPRHSNNWVYGAIADDKVFDVVDAYRDNKISAEEAILRMRALPNTYQLTLHTISALRYLDDKNVLYTQLLNNAWCKWKERV